MKKNKNQSGRSMVEMLGVLAIIGVLSVGGIAGYNAAMDKIAKNNILELLNKLEIALEAESLNPETILVYDSSTDDELSQEQSEMLCHAYFGAEACTDKKSAYIGASESLGQVRTFYKYKNIQWMIARVEGCNSKPSISIRFRGVPRSVCRELTNYIFDTGKIASPYNKYPNNYVLALTGPQNTGGCAYSQGRDYYVNLCDDSRWDMNEYGNPFGVQYMWQPLVPKSSDDDQDD